MTPLMYNSLRRLLLLTIASTMALAPAVAQAPCPEAPPASVVAPRLAVLAMLPPQQAGTPSQEQEATQEDASTAYDAERRKTIDKTFKVSRADMLNIENEFGKVHVNTWDKNEMHVKVVIIARAATDARAQDILEHVNIIESREGNTYAFQTRRAPMRISGNSHKSFEINYTVYMPESNPLTLKHSFGDVYLANLKGKVDVSMKHGVLRSEGLSNTGNILNLTYGSGSCNYINGGNVDLAYFDMSVGETVVLRGASKYSNFTINNLGEVLEMDLKYGSLKVNNVSKGVQKIDIKSGFCPISLNFEDNAAFNFDVNLQHGSFNVDKSLVTITHLERNHTSEELRGKFGGASPKGMVSINSKFDNVKFTK